MLKESKLFCSLEPHSQSWTLSRRVEGLGRVKISPQVSSLLVAIKRHMEYLESILVIIIEHISNSHVIFGFLQNLGYKTKGPYNKSHNPKVKQLFGQNSYRGKVKCLKPG
jgi:hypothetical protein